MRRRKRRRTAGNGRQRVMSRDGSDRCKVGFRKVGTGRKEQR